MADPKVFFSLPDNGGRRSGIDRRNFCYTAHIPERRQGLERRSGLDRRQEIAFKGRLTGNKRFGPRGKMEKRMALKLLTVQSFR